MRHLAALSVVSVLLGCAARPVTTPAPEPGPVGEAVTFPSAGERVGGFLCRPGSPGRYPGLVMIHGDFGLTDGVKEQAKRLAGRGYAVLAVDLYRGQAVPSLMDAHILSRGLPESRALGDVKAAADYLAGRDDVRGDALGVVGWDSGGGYAVDAALKDPRLRAAVVCYGRVPTDAQALAPLRASVLGIFAGADEGVSPQTIRQFRAAMEKAGKRVAGVHVYPHCDSGFLDPSAPSSAGPPPADAVADAWRRIETYLDEELKR